MRPALVLLTLMAACGDLERPDAFDDDLGEARTLGEPTSQLTATPAGPDQAPDPRLEWEPDPRPVPEAAPLSLTASDGTGLLLRALQVQSVITDPLAFTELHLTFDNPEDRVLEGRFEITLPPGAAIGRFAMKIDGRWQEGEVVETQAARRAYEDFLHRRQDPALMEKDAGNQFRARVFPIPARGTKELIVSYSTELGADQAHEVTLRGLPRLDRFDARVLVENPDGAPQELVVSERDFVPDRDLRVRVQPASATATGVRSGELVAVRLQPHLDTVEAPVEALTVLVDTSASRALGFEPAMLRLEQALHALDADQGGVRLDVRAFDQDVAAIYTGPAADFTADALLDRGALGASDLQGALEHLAGSPPAARVLLVTDGVATAGEVDALALRERVTALGDVGVRRLDAWVEGGIRDTAMLAELVTAGLPEDGVVVDADADDEGVARLTSATASGIEVSVPGAAWVWPDTLNGLQSGDDVWVYAEVPAGGPFAIGLHGAHLSGTLQLRSASRPLLARAAAGARIARLEHLRAKVGDDDQREALRQQIIDLSVTHRVLSDHTALLVLETEADYARHGIARRGLADILTVGPDGLEVRERGEEALPLPVEAEKKPKKTKKRSKGEGLEDGPMPATDPGAVDPGPSSGAQPGDAGDALEVLEALGYASPEPEAEPPERSAGPTPSPQPSPRPRRRPEVAEERMIEPRADAYMDEPSSRRPAHADPWTGRFAEVRALLDGGKHGAALEEALAWRASDPADVLALVALGEAYTALGDRAAAARAYGAIIDLFPSRADLRRMAGERLEALGPVGLPLAVDSYGKALAQRPDHPSSHRLYAFGLVQQDRLAEAFDVALGAHQRPWIDGRFAGVERILAEDLGLIAAALKRAEPARAAEIDATVGEVGGVMPDGETLRFVLYWETDANDVDFHIYDGRNGHAFYGDRELPSGGTLYADVTTGYGPECFTIPDPDAFPYTLQAHYYSRGPMGYGMGTLQTLAHDGKGGLTFASEPFVIMKDRATVDLGRIER